MAETGAGESTVKTVKRFAGIERTLREDREENRQDRKDWGRG